MQLIMYIVVGLVALWALYAAYIWRVSRSAKGRAIRDLGSGIPELERIPDRALVYCYTPRCAPCKRMTPIVDALREEGAPIVKLEIAQKPGLARDLGIKATPTLLRVIDGHVQGVVIGARSQAQIRRLLG